MQRELDVLPPPGRAMAVYMKNVLPNAFEENQVKLKSAQVCTETRKWEAK
jgi:hypothetical protein